MNENQNQILETRWKESCAQHTALAMMIGDLRKEICQLRGIVIGLAQAEGRTVTVEDHTGPASGEKAGIEDYLALLKLARQGLAEPPPPTG